MQVNLSVVLSDASRGRTHPIRGLSDVLIVENERGVAMHQFCCRPETLPPVTTYVDRFYDMIRSR